MCTVFQERIKVREVIEGVNDYVCFIPFVDECILLKFVTNNNRTGMAQSV
jgi:hypothetical protein